MLRSFGFREDDPRFKHLMERVRDIEKEEEERSCEAQEQKHWKMEKEQFIE